MDLEIFLPSQPTSTSLFVLVRGFLFDFSLCLVTKAKHHASPLERATFATCTPPSPSLAQRSIGKQSTRAYSQETSLIWRRDFQFNDKQTKSIRLSLSLCCSNFSSRYTHKSDRVRDRLVIFPPEVSLPLSVSHFSIYANARARWQDVALSKTKKNLKNSSFDAKAHPVPIDEVSRKRERAGETNQRHRSYFSSSSKQFFRLWLVDVLLTFEKIQSSELESN